jgi:glutathione peroxidase
MSENGIHFNRERFDKRKNKSTRNSIVLVVLLLVLIGAWIYLSKTAKGAAPASTETSIKSDMKKVTDFFLTGKNGAEVSLAEYKGKVLLIVNTATGCGFTPQYNELEAMYKKLKDKGFEILDIPCNQFGNQTPGTDEEITEFCQLKFGTDFPQFKKSDVNGPNELPLYTWLKSQKGFEGFDADNKLTPILEKMFDENAPGWRETSDIKWNFTKFLANRDGDVVARFEPTCSMDKVEQAVEALL